MRVNSGDTLLIPEGNDQNRARVNVQWQQTFRNKSEDYYVIIAKNKSQNNEDVMFFVQENWYNDQHLGSKNNGFYELKVDGRCQYGQKNQEGEGRFVVLHDKDRKPYQHRFVETALLSVLARNTVKVAAGLGFPAEMGSQVHSLAKGLFGDYLHTF